MEAAQDRGRPHPAACYRPVGPFLAGLRDSLRQALVRAVPVEVAHVLAQGAPQMGLAEDEQMIEAFAPGRRSSSSPPSSSTSSATR
ncbi:MAG: hypothetical protein AVDCRST_MAG88-3582 [uncultured Thermomicrobiales bacterium]|uniref:Uncharacterized protein n=1 Tax=uncultured Thermomicrobiales bacterium TaxID=1645740 RepID=A0A6J4VNJ7_9BACT|nr:MAG: hypothetical protein AVDCRST_MAG88-3582 [uncultured Thermomicrobiales bacterium]